MFKLHFSSCVFLWARVHFSTWVAEHSPHKEQLLVIFSKSIYITMDWHSRILPHCHRPGPSTRRRSAYMVSTHSFFETIPPFVYVDWWHPSSSIYPGSYLWHAEPWKMEVIRSQGEIFRPSSHSHSPPSRHPLKSKWIRHLLVHSLLPIIYGSSFPFDIRLPIPSSNPSPVTQLTMLYCHLVVSFPLPNCVVVLCSSFRWNDQH